MEKREIKFRAWEKPDPTVKFEGKMHYDIQSVLDKWLDSDDYEIMQFTGLLDRHGKEIYEGDIIESLDRIFGGNGSKNRRVVEFKNGCFEVDTMRLALLNEKSGGGLTFEPEIIGNIYESPELLTK